MPPALPEQADVVLTSRREFKAGDKRAPDQSQAAASPEAVAAVKASREKLLARHAERQVEEAGPAATEEEPSVIREDIASIEVMLLDGRVVEMRPAQNLTYKVATIVAGDPAAAYLSVIAKTLLSIRSINGNDPPIIRSKVELVGLMEKLGDDNLEILQAAYNTTWPPLTTADVRIVKKNLRQP